MSFKISPADPKYSGDTDLLEKHKDLIEKLKNVDEKEITLDEFMNIIGEYNLLIDLGANCSGVDVIDLTNELIVEWTW